MQVLRQSTREKPKISLVLLDWGVRESFHLLHYLQNQTIPRETFEVIVVEYYSKISPALKQFESEVDTLVLLELPDDCYYHKHLMYNVGIVMSRGEILMFADSDAMVRPTFLEVVVKTFDREPLLVYHMDQFRNVRHDLYPFRYPSFEDVVGDGCINYADGKTKGVLDAADPIHSRNYGACMCARRSDIIAIGGADEDQSYLGHVCGPYEMTFRLMHFGRRLEWETEEYLYHTWHPGSDGTDNYLGPHDGRNMSTTAFQALCSGRVRPLVENEAIRRLRTGDASTPNRDLIGALINPAYAEGFHRAKLGSSAKRTVSVPLLPKEHLATYRGFDVYQVGECYYGVPVEFGPVNPAASDWCPDERVIQATSFDEIRQILEEADTVKCVETVGICNICSLGRRFAVVPLALGVLDFHVPSHRGNPQIVWVDDLEEARKVARSLEPPNESAAARVDPGQLVHDIVLPLEKQIAELQERLGGFESNLIDLHESVLQRETRLTEMDFRIAGAESGLQDAQHSVTGSANCTAALEQRAMGMENGLADMHRQTEESCKYLRELEQRLDALETNLRQTGERLMDSQERAAALDTAVADLNRQAAESRERVTIAEQSLDSAEANFRAIDRHLTDLQKHTAAQEKRLNSIESGLQQTEQVLLEPKRRIEELTGALARTESAVSAIYQSRTWRILTWFGGILLRISGMRRAHPVDAANRTGHQPAVTADQNPV